MHTYDIILFGIAIFGGLILAFRAGVKVGFDEGRKDPRDAKGRYRKRKPEEWL